MNRQPHGLRGFTLVELLVSAAIGMLLLALATNAFVYLRRTIQRNLSLVALHGEAAAFHRVLGDALGEVHPGAQWRLEADPGADGAWGGDDDEVRLSFLCAAPSRTARTWTFGKDWGCELAWTRLTWRARGPNGQPALLFARSDGFVASPLTWSDASGSHTTEIRSYPQPRRDRRRDLDDNDLRFVPGATAALLAAAPLAGDGTDLAAQAAPLSSPRTRVVDVAIGWYDGRGHWTGFDRRRAPGRGIVECAADGTDVPLLSQPWSNERAVVLDGLRLDGERTTVAPDPVDSADRRPLLATIAFTLVDTADAGGGPTDDPRAPRQTFSFTFPLSPVLGGF